jgi:hypothetical protein
VDTAWAMEIKEAKVFFGTIPLMLVEIIFRIQGMIAQHNHISGMFCDQGSSSN